MMLERAKETTRYGRYTCIEYARFADDPVILIDAHPRHDWLMGAVEKRLREELAELQVEINEEKSRVVDLGRGESFGFLGFDFRRRAVVGVFGVPITRRNSRNRQRCCGSSKTCSAATNRNQSAPADVLARQKVEGSRFGGQCEMLRDAFLWAFPDLPDPFLGSRASELASSTDEEGAQVLHLLDQIMKAVAGQKRAPAWVRASYSPEHKKWKAAFSLCWSRLSSDRRIQYFGTTESWPAEREVWARIEHAVLMQHGWPEVRSGRSKLLSADILKNADEDAKSILQGVLSKGTLLNSFTLGMWLRNHLVDGPIDGLVLRARKDRNDKQQFWIEHNEERRKAKL